MNLHAIYSLADPRDLAVRYIGRSNQPGQRLKQHVWEASMSDRTARGVWLRELAAAGLSPVQSIIEWCDADAAVARERGWIYWYAMNGADLVNTQGPTGMRGRYVQQVRDARKAAIRSARAQYPQRTWQEIVADPGRAVPPAATVATDLEERP